MSQATGIVGLLVVVGTLMSGIAGQEPGRAVPAEWLNGDRLTVPDLNFSISTPAGWRWRQQDVGDIQGSKATAFLAISPQDDLRYLVAVWQRESRSLTQSDAEGVARGMTESLPEGWTVITTDVTKRERPVPISTRVLARLRAPDGSDYYMHGYMASGRRSYMILAYLPTETEPQDFADFANSFRFLQPKVNERMPKPIPGLLLILAIVGAVVDYRYVKAGGLRSTRKERAYLGVATGLCIVVLVVFGTLGASAEALGAASVDVSVFLFALWELGRFRTRRDNPIPPRLAN